MIRSSWFEFDSRPILLIHGLLKSASQLWIAPIIELVMYLGLFENGSLIFPLHTLCTYLPKKKASWGSFLQDSAHCGHNHRSFTLLEFGDSFQKSLIVYQDFSSMVLKFSYGCMVILVTKYWWRVNCFFGEKNFHEIFYFS